MKCPTCSTSLVMTDRQGIEIDYCPDCRGVWLDRGELDKLIERASGSASKSSRKDIDHDDGDSYFDRFKYSRYPKKKRKMSSVLGDIFDFG